MRHLHGLVVQLAADLLGERLERADGVADDLQLVVLRAQHALLRRQQLIVARGAVVRGQLGVLAVLGRGGPRVAEVHRALVAEQRLSSGAIVVAVPVQTHFRFHHLEQT